MENTGFTDLKDIEEIEDTENQPTLQITAINKVMLFTKEQCEEIVNNTIDELWLPLHTVGRQDYHIAKRQKLRGDIEGFPFLDIRNVTKNANTTIYDFSLLGIIDQDFPQIFRYSDNNYFDMHIDINHIAPSRKITFIINLSDQSTYEGGSIEFLNFETIDTDVNEQGSCLIFPAFMPYKLNKVTKGHKDIIIGHVHGALFR